jgi:hypothetical protein
LGSVFDDLTLPFLFSFALMKNGVCILNFSRDQIVNDALLDDHGHQPCDAPPKEKNLRENLDIIII